MVGLNGRHIAATIPTFLPGVGPGRAFRRYPTPIVRRPDPPPPRRVREAPDQRVAARAVLRRAAPPRLVEVLFPRRPRPSRVVDLFRLRAEDGARHAGAPIPPELVARSLLVYNPLSAPVFLRFGVGDASPATHDVACPGSAVLSWPLDPSATRISAVVDYAGAVPPGDVAEAVVRVTDEVLSPSIGPLAP